MRETAKKGHDVDYPGAQRRRGMIILVCFR
jgi:hypothetical protein